MTRSMKDSGIEWIGKIPEEWDIIKLKRLGECRNGLTYSPYEITSSDKGTLVLRSSNIQNGKLCFDDNVYVSTSIKKELMVKKGDILICSRNGSRALIGKSALISSDIHASFGAFMMIFRCNSPEYIHYVLASHVFSYYLGTFLTATINQLTADNFKNMQIVFCNNTDEQLKIVKYLDQKCANIDNIITKTQASIEEYKRLRQAIITQAVTKGVRGDRPMKDSGIEWIGEIPAEWKVCKFKHIICKKIDNRGRTPELLDTNNGIPLVEVASLGKKHPDLSAVKKYISKESHDEYIRDDVQVGDLLITTVGATIGKCSIVDVPCFCIAQNLVGYRVNSNNYPLFWYYYFQSNAFQDMFALYDKGNTINNVKISNMEQGSIVVASYDEQFQIAEHLDKKCAEIDSLIIKKEQLLTEYENYKKAMIYEYVTGKKET